MFVSRIEVTGELGARRPLGAERAAGCIPKHECFAYPAAKFEGI